MSITKTLFLLCAAVGSTNGFAIAPSSAARSTDTFSPMTATITKTASAETTTTLFSKTRLQYKNQDEVDEYLYVDNTLSEMSPLVSDVVEIQRSSPAFLPRAEQDRRRADKMMDAEMMVGRTAMVAAFFLFGTELLTGSSLPDQISNFVM